MKTYEDLSRRALIQLGHEYDELNDNRLQKFLTHNEDLYEGIRPVERIIDGCDQAIETVFGSRVSVCQSICSAGGTVIGAVGEALATAAGTVINAGAKHLVEML